MGTPKPRKIRTQWIAGYEALKAYLKYANRWPTRDVTFRQVRIGRWCENQRNRKNSLSEEQKKLLNEIRFIWRAEDPFFVNFDKLTAFRKLNPDAWPQQKGSTSEKALGRWLSKQQVKARAGNLSDQHLKLLQNIDTPLGKEWDRNYAVLTTYMSAYNRFPVQSEKYKNLNLGQWCTNQRLLRRKKQLSKNRVKKLNAINFVWEPYEAEWLNHYSALIKFRRQHPRRWPMATEEYLKLKLGSWCVRQRVMWRTGEIQKSNRILLEKIHFPWAVDGSIYTLPDLRGLKFNRLLVKGSGAVTRDGKRTWRCLCECGRICSITSYALTSGKQKSCGCLLRQKAAARMHIVQKKSSEARLQSATQVQERINKVHGSGVIILYRDSYKNVFEPALMEHVIYGQWKARPINVYRGASHPSAGRARTNLALEARRLTEDQINGRLPSYVRIKPGTFKATSQKADFIDVEYGVWSANVSNVLAGSRHPDRGNRARVEKGENTNLKKYGKKYIAQVIEFQLKAMKKQARVYRKRHWKTKRILYCRGNWETAVVDYLNRNKRDYLWQPEIFSIPKSVMVTPRGNATTYCPDLYLVQEKIWVEIKGYFREDAIVKWAWFVEQHPTAELWDLRRLRELKILRR